MAPAFIHLLRVGVVLLAVVTLVGLFAPVFPHADIFNHFRPWMLVSAIAVFAIAPARANLTFPVITLVTLNAALFLIPWATNNASAVQGAEGSKVSFISINVLTRNQTPAKVVDYITTTNADVVLLQEMSKRMRDAVLPRLTEQYPFVHRCNCQNMVILAKKPLTEVGGQPRTRTQPPLIWARLKTASGRAFHVMGIHTTYPINPVGHARQFNWLINRFPKFDGPLVLAGDFNATPWSWNLTNFGWRNGMTRVFTLSFGWPSHWPFQILMIDNFFISKHVHVESTHIGPHVGSDHRPVIARLIIGD